MRTMSSIWEALIALDVYSCAFNGHVSPVATRPVAAEVAEMPGFVHVSFHLLFCKVMLDDQSDDAKVDVEIVLARRVLPDEIALDGAYRAPVIAVSRWRGVKPAKMLAA